MNIWIRLITMICFMVFPIAVKCQQASIWNVPVLTTNAIDQDQLYDLSYGPYDINGDGYADLIDAEDDVTSECWLNGTQRYWKVYYNSGTSFSTTATTWNVPTLETNAIDQDQVSDIGYGLFDFNGDGFLDLYDTDDEATGACWLNGTQRYWKVFYNNGNSFSSTATIWNVPTVTTDAIDQDQLFDLSYGPYDINGDGYADLIDAEDDVTSECWLNGTQRYWKVYYNNGTSFSTTATTWNVPTLETNSIDQDQVSDIGYGLFDFNGDGLLDLYDTDDEATGACWLNGTQRYWKVFYNNGNSFSSTATIWNVPTVTTDAIDQDQLFDLSYGPYDINGDGYADLIDAEDDLTSECWLNGTQRYWKVYYNSGTSFSTTATIWNVPSLENNPIDQDQVNDIGYGLFDFNGDGLLDLYDTDDEATGACWLNGTQRYWKVFLNNGNSFGNTQTSITDDLQNMPAIYPNPTGQWLYVRTCSIADRIEIIDLKGTTLLVARHADKINIGKLADGTYTLRLFIGNKVLVKTILKSE